VGKLHIDFFEQGALAVAKRHIGNIEHGLDFLRARRYNTILLFTRYTSKVVWLDLSISLHLATLNELKNAF
jgi:hypothetical protein